MNRYEKGCNTDKKQFFEYIQRTTPKEVLEEIMMVPVSSISSLDEFDNIENDVESIKPERLGIEDKNDIDSATNFITPTSTAGQNANAAVSEEEYYDCEEISDECYFEELKEGTMSLAVKYGLDEIDKQTLLDYFSRLEAKIKGWKNTSTTKVDDITSTASVAPLPGA